MKNAPLPVTLMSSPYSPLYSTIISFPLVTSTWLCFMHYPRRPLFKIQHVQTGKTFWVPHIENCIEKLLKRRICVVLTTNC